MEMHGSVAKVTSYLYSVYDVKYQNFYEYRVQFQSRMLR